MLARGSQWASSAYVRAAGRVGRMGKPIPLPKGNVFVNPDAMNRALVSRGKRRIKYGAGGVAGIGVLNAMRTPKGSGSTGLSPHSSGGATLGGMY